MHVLPKKTIGTGALIFNQDKKILIVKPTYRDCWSFVGGIIEDFESPSNGLKREVKEEVGLNVYVVKPLVIEHLTKHNQEKQSESIQILFLCELAENENFSNIVLDEDEIAEYKFVHVNEAMNMISRRSANRLKAGLKSLEKDTLIYLENKYCINERIN